MWNQKISNKNFFVAGIAELIRLILYQYYFYTSYCVLTKQNVFTLYSHKIYNDHKSFTQVKNDLVSQIVHKLLHFKFYS